MLQRPDFKNDIYASGRGNNPFYFDSDYFCSLCGEPWDKHHIKHELTPHQRKQFFDGNGCQACKFGTKLHFQFKGDTDQ